MPRRPTASGPTQPYATKQARGTARPISVSLSAEWLARLDALRARYGLRRSEMVRCLIEWAEGSKSAPRSATDSDE